jgi:hypothetical protein
MGNHVFVVVLRVSLRQSGAMHEVAKARVRAERIQSQIGFDEVSEVRGSFLVRFFQELKGFSL